MTGRLLRAATIDAPHGFETRHGDLGTVLPRPLHRPWQVHGGEVHTLENPTQLAPYRAVRVEDRPAADALITALPATTVSVSTADCVPVLLHDPGAPAVGAAHAGWRGIAAGILPATVARMAEQLGAEPARMRAAIGPCIGRDAYVVGPDVVEAFAAAGLPDSVFAPMEGADPPTWRCDLVGAARLQLVTAGIPDAAVESLDRCTFSEPLFDSYRRDGEAAGRMVAGIALPG